MTACAGPQAPAGGEAVADGEGVGVCCAGVAGVRGVGVAGIPTPPHVGQSPRAAAFASASALAMTAWYLRLRREQIEDGEPFAHEPGVEEITIGPDVAEVAAERVLLGGVFFEPDGSG